MLSMMGIILAVIVLVVLAWNRWNAIVCALIATLIVGVFSGFGLWGTLTDFFLPAAGKWVSTFILMFLTSAMYAKLLGDCGAASRIAYWILNKTGEKFIYPVLILICMILTYGGVNALIIIFVFWPIALPIARKMNKPRYLFLLIMYFGFLTGANTAMPGSPQTGNVAAAQILGTSSTAAPLLGILSTILMFAFTVWFIFFLDKRAAKKGRTFETGVGIAMKERAEESCPPMWRALVPLAVLLVLFVVFSNGFFGIEKLSATVAVTSANVIASIVCLALNFKYYLKPEGSKGALAGIKDSVLSGLMSGLNPAASMFCMVAFFAVIAATPAFEIITGWIMSSTDQPYFQSIIATQLLGVVVGSAGATATSVCNTFGAQWLAVPGISADALTRIISIGSAGFSTVPYSAGLFVNLDVTGSKMKDIWPAQFVGVAIPSVVCAVLCALLAMAGIA